MILLRFKENIDVQKFKASCVISNVLFWALKALMFKILKKECMIKKV